MRRQEVSDGARAGGMLGRVRRLGRGGQPGGGTGAGRVQGPGSWPAGRQDSALDWRNLQERLDPVLRHRWDVAILVNLDEREGRRSAQLLAAINTQAAGAWQLSPQVLSVRLRALEQDGYVAHEDISRIPLTRVYRLLPPGRGLIEDLRSVSFLLTTQASRATTCTAELA